MVREAIGVGETEIDALNDAKKQLGIDESVDVDFELIQRPEKKKFGLFGGAPAKVKVTLKATPIEAAEEFLNDVIKAMKLENFEISKNETEDSVDFTISGDDAGYIIGRRGETLDAIQYLTSLVANQVGEKYFKVRVDTESYREKRETTLEILGRKLAFKAIKTGRKTSLEPMNPYERRIIHTAVQKVRGATSWSEGENMNRHVVIGPDPDARPRYDRRNNNNNRGRRGGYNRSGESTTSTPTREPINEGSLYGKL